jgi:hypothetical protein
MSIERSPEPLRVQVERRSGTDRRKYHRSGEIDRRKPSPVHLIRLYLNRTVGTVSNDVDLDQSLIMRHENSTFAFINHKLLEYYVQGLLTQLSNQFDAKVDRGSTAIIQDPSTGEQVLTLVVSQAGLEAAMLAWKREFRELNGEVFRRTPWGCETFRDWRIKCCGASLHTINVLLALPEGTVAKYEAGHGDFADIRNALIDAKLPLPLINEIEELPYG